MRKIILMLTLISFFGIQSVFAQTTVRGTVTSADDGGTLPGVSVIIEGTSLGTTTDMDGKFTLNVPDGSTAIVFSFIGMQTQTIAYTGQTTINVVLKSSSQVLDEVLVIAYGTAKKGAFTGSATQINAEKLELRPVTNVTSAIEGASPGVQVTGNSGQPGSGPEIHVRGIGSFSASSTPLYVVDGVPFSGQISSINANDIESLTILKDAASTALYGNKAANGVVMITTKKGRKGKGQLSVNFSQGITGRSIPEYERVGVMDYYLLTWEAMSNSKGGDEAANLWATENLIDELGYNITNVADDQLVVDGVVNPSASIIPTYNDLNWEDEIMRVGHRANYDINYKGGTDNSDYYISLGYLDETGYTIKSDFKRFSARANANLQATDWFKTGLNITGATSTGNQAYESSSSAFVNPFRFTRGIGPIYPVYAHDAATGAFILDANGDKIYDLVDNRPGGASSGRHIVAETNWDTDKDEITTLGAKTYGEFKLYKDLTFTVNASFDQRHYFNTTADNKIIGDGAPGGRAYRTYSRRTSLNFNQLLNYSKSFEMHNFKLVLGHENYDYTYNYLYGSKTVSITDGNTELDNYVNITGLSSYTDTYTTEGYFGRLDYDYDGKYFLTASLRRDGSSKFATDVRWGDFWSLGGAWRMDQEDFIKQIDFIDMLKLRGSYGQVGNDAGIDYYAYQALYALGWNNQAESGFLQSKLAADQLVWESNNSFDIGVEFGVFNKLFGTIEFYHRISDNLLFAVPLPLSSGLESADQNIGTMYNQGIEVSLSYDVVKTQNFNWNINANFSTLKNEFTKLPQDEIINGSKKLMVGHSIYDYWLTEWYGVDPDDGSALYRADPAVFDAGNSDFRFIGNDTVTIESTDAKYHYAGTAIPDLYGAFTNTFTYKAFELSVMFTYQIGGKVMDYTYQDVMSSGTYGSSMSVDLLDRWQNPGDITNVPRMDVSRTSDFNATSDRWLTDASYLALRSLNFSYNLPQNLLDNLGVSKARVYFSGENLFLLNARKGMNVTQNFAGTTSNVYTPSRVMTVGVNVNF